MTMSLDLQYYLDVVKYDVLKMPAFFDYTIIPGHIDFDSHYDEYKNLHWLETEDLPDFYVSGKDKLDLANHVGDTLLVYYDVPTYFAKKWHPDKQTFSFENKKTGEHEYVSLDYEEELKRAAA